MKRKNCTIYVVRHGETEGNVNRVLQGYSDFPLTKKGIDQAKELAKKFSTIRFEAVFSSDLLRAKRTAEIITLEKKMVVKTTQAIRERNFGKFEGKNWEVVNRQLKKLIEEYEKLSEEDKFKKRVHDEIESDEEVATRFILFLREIAIAYTGKTVMMVSHGGIMRAVLIHLGFGNYDEMPLGVVKNLGYFKMVSDGVDFEIKETWNIEKKV